MLSTREVILFPRGKPYGTTPPGDRTPSSALQPVLECARCTIGEGRLYCRGVIHIGTYNMTWTIFYLTSRRVRNDKMTQRVLVTRALCYDTPFVSHCAGARSTTTSNQNRVTGCEIQSLDEERKRARVDPSAQPCTVQYRRSSFQGPIGVGEYGHTFLE